MKLKTRWQSLSDRHKGILLSLGSSLAFAGMNLCVPSLCSNLVFSEISFFRGILGFMALFPFVWRRIPGLFQRRFALYWLRCFSGALSVCCFFWTLAQVGVGVSMALNLVSVVFTALLAVLFLGERLTLREMLGLTLVVLGTISLQSPWGASLSNQVVGVGLLGAFFTSLAYLSLRKVTQLVSTDLIVVGFLMLMAGVSLGFDFSSWSWPSWQAWPGLILMASLGLLAQFLLTAAFFYLPAVLASTLSLLSLVFGLLLEAIREMALPSGSVLLAQVGMLAGVFLLQNRDNKKEAVDELE